MHSYTDEAMGYFPVDEAVSEGVHRVVVNWRFNQVCDGTAVRFDLAGCLHVVR